MKHLLYFIICLPLVYLTSCDVHEWPELPEKVSTHVRLYYETNMTIWNHLHDGTKVIEQGYGETYDNQLKVGKIRYIIRTYTVSEKQRSLKEHIQEFVFTKDLAEGYDHEVTLDLLPGEYNLMVWSDLISEHEQQSYYNANNFAQIYLQGKHMGNDDYRDTFRGESSLLLYPNIINQIPDTIHITMKRPMAKFEIIANDLLEFIELNTENINLYQTKIQYIGFMPDTYSMFIDKPVDSSTGVVFQSKLKELTKSEVSMGSDYVFVGNRESVVTIKIGIYNHEGKQVSMTKSIEIPLKPNHHTILTGKYLMQNASGGINLNPDFDGNYNIIFPW